MPIEIRKSTGKQLPGIVSIYRKTYKRKSKAVSGEVIPGHVVVEYVGNLERFTPADLDADAAAINYAKPATARLNTDELATLNAELRADAGNFMSVWPKQFIEAVREQVLAEVRAAAAAPVAATATPVELAIAANAAAAAYLVELGRAQPEGKSRALWTTHYVPLARSFEDAEKAAKSVKIVITRDRSPEGRAKRAADAAAKRANKVAKGLNERTH